MAYDDTLYRAYVNAGRVDECLDILERKLDGVDNDDDFRQFMESFPKGGIMTLLCTKRDIFPRGIRFDRTHKRRFSVLGVGAQDQIFGGIVRSPKKESGNYPVAMSVVLQNLIRFPVQMEEKYTVASAFWHLTDPMLAGRMMMHACQIGPTDVTPPCPGSPHQACVGTRGNALRQATFLPSFLHCYLCVWMVRLHSPFIGSQAWVLMAARCL